MISRNSDVLHRSSYGRGTGSERERPRAPFKGRYPLLEDIRRRVHQPRIDVARFRKREAAGRLCGIPEHIGSRGVDRHCSGISRRIGLFLPDMDLKRFESVI